MAQAEVFQRTVSTDGVRLGSDDEGNDVTIDQTDRKRSDSTSSDVESEWRCKSCGEIVTGPMIAVSGGFYHPECFMCPQCHQLIAFDQSYKFRGGVAYCEPCYRRPLSQPGLSVSSMSSLEGSSSDLAQKLSSVNASPRPRKAKVMATPPVVSLEGSPATSPQTLTRTLTLGHGRSASYGQHRAFHEASKQPRQGTFRIDDLDWVKVIGKGFFGAVWKVVHKATSEAFAVKEMRQQGNEEAIEAFTKEVAVLKRLCHPNILEFVGVFRKSKNVYLMTEFVEGGTVRDHIKDNSKDFPWALRLRFAVDMAEGMAYLHQKQIIHRDLKSKNCLVRRDWSVCVADFGLARLAQSLGPSRMTICGSPYWMAPEMMLRGEYHLSADVFSFGIIMGELAARIRATPDEFPRTDKMGVDVCALEKLCSLNTPPGYVDLVAECCSLEADKRPQFGDISRRLRAMLQTAYPMFQPPNKPCTLPKHTKTPSQDLTLPVEVQAEEIDSP